MKEFALVEGKMGTEPLLVNSVLIFPSTLSEHVLQPIGFRTNRPTAWIQSVFEEDMTDKQRAAGTLRQAYHNMVVTLNAATGTEHMVLVRDNELEEVRAAFSTMEEKSQRHIDNVVLISIEELMAAFEGREDEADHIR